MLLERKRVTGAVALGTLLTAIGATSALAGDLHYYDSINYGHRLGSFACMGKTMHDVPDDVIDSVKNQTACDFSARSWGAIPNTTIEVGSVARGQVIPSFGSRNNQIDHFDKR